MNPLLFVFLAFISALFLYLFFAIPMWVVAAGLVVGVIGLVVCIDRLAARRVRRARNSHRKPLYTPDDSDLWRDDRAGE